MMPTDSESPGLRVAHSLREVSALLNNSLLGGSAAIYLCTDDKRKLVIAPKSAANQRFVRSVKTDAFSNLMLVAEKGAEAKASILSSHDLSLLLAGGKGRTDSLPASERPVVMARPLISGENLLGLLVMHIGPQPIDHEQALKNLEGIALIIQQTLAQESELNALQAQKAFLSQLVQKAEDIDITSTPDVMIKSVVQLVKGVLTFDRLTISSPYSQVHEGLEIGWVEGLEEKYTAGYRYLSKGVCHGAVFSKIKGLKIDNFKASKFKGRFEAGDFEQTNLKSFLGVPIMAAGTPQGVLALESLEVDHYNLLDLDVLRAIIQVFGPAICWSKRYQEVHAMATVDGLTQLLNHKSFMQRLSEELERDTRYGESMTLLMLDLDHFKQVNDQHGHQYGDYVLRQTAQLIRSSIRKADIAGRIGGEEFAVIVINASRQTGRSTADRIKHSIADHPFSLDGVESRVTISIGMSEYPRDGKHMKAILKKADEAMYRVKEAGGNDVVSYSRANSKIRKDA